MDDASKTRVIEYFNVETWLLFAHPLSKFLATRLIPIGLLQGVSQLLKQSGSF